MAFKYYTFDYAEMKGSHVANLGSLCFSTDIQVTSTLLKTYTRRHLNCPSADIIISNVSKSDKQEYEQLIGFKK